MLSASSCGTLHSPPVSALLGSCMTLQTIMDIHSLTIGEYPMLDLPQGSRPPGPEEEHSKSGPFQGPGQPEGVPQMAVHSAATGTCRCRGGETTLRRFFCLLLSDLVRAHQTVACCLCRRASWARPSRASRRRRRARRRPSWHQHRRPRRPHCPPRTAAAAPTARRGLPTTAAWARPSQAFLRRPRARCRPSRRHNRRPRRPRCAPRTALRQQRPRRRGEGSRRRRPGRVRLRHS